MAKKTTFDLPALVDAFVQKINTDPREPAHLDEVPEFLREKCCDPSCQWNCVPAVQTGFSCDDCGFGILTNDFRNPHLSTIGVRGASVRHCALVKSAVGIKS